MSEPAFIKLAVFPLLMVSVAIDYKHKEATLPGLGCLFHSRCRVDEGGLFGVL